MVPLKAPPEFLLLCDENGIAFVVEETHDGLLVQAYWSEQDKACVIPWHGYSAWMTTGSTVLVLDEQLQLRGRGYQEFRQIYPQPGWVEHDPEDIWRSVTAALGQALKGIDLAAIAAIGITNQRETSVLWDRKSGEAMPDKQLLDEVMTLDILKMTSDSRAKLG